MLQVYVHPRCSESFHVYQLVTELGLLNVSFVNTELDPFGALSKGVFAVPAFEKDGKIILQGWFTREDLLSLLKEGVIKVSSKEEAFERLLRSVTASFTVASAVYVVGDLSIVSGSPEYVMSASGAFFLSGGEEFLDYAMWKLRETEFASIEEKLLRSIAANFARDAYWLRGSIPTRRELENMGSGFFETWLAARASIGRVFVPHSYAWEGARERVKRAWSYLLEHIDEIGPRVREEQEGIPRDWI
ncbi:MAG: hypothetical protein QXQ34_03145 [Thermofilum sp.]